MGKPPERKEEMLKEHCRVGMKVVCGRPNGEKTVGEVVEIHEKKAEVRTLESRGDGNRGSEEHRTKKQPAGTVWGFTFDLMEPLAPALLEALRSLPPKEERLLEYLERGSESLIGKSINRRASMFKEEELATLQTIFVNYEARKSLSSSYWKYRRMRTTEADMEADSLLLYWKDHNQRLSLLFQILGRPVSESVIRAWEDDRRIQQEIKKEFPNTTEMLKARHHWRRIRDEIFPHDYDHKERILVWNERRLSEAWIKAGLNEPSTATHRFPAPRPLDWVRRSTPTA